MIKVRVIENFTLGKFYELKNIVRNSEGNTEGFLYVNDTFECTEEMVEYLTKTNAKGRAFVEVIEIIPEENSSIEIIPEEKVEIKPIKKRRTSKKNIENNN